MDFCQKLGLVNVSIFSDSLEAVKAVHFPEDDLSPEGSLACEINDLIKSLPFLSITHMRCSANGVAHLLARKALTLQLNFECSNDDDPSWLKNIVSHDLMY